MMKLILTTLILFFTLLSCQQPTNKVKSNAETNEELAKRLGADEYGMKKYVMAFLKRGPNPSKDSITAAKNQKAHLENIGRMAEEGTLVLAGPFLDGTDLRGIYIFNVETIEEAQKLTATDPLIQSGGLIMELHPWYGSAGLMELSKIHKKISEKNP